MPPRLGSVDPSAFPDEEFDLYSIPAFDRGTPDIVEGAEIGSAKQIVLPGDVLLSRIVPHIRRAWIVGQDRGRRIIASGEWIVFRGEGVDQGYLRNLLMSDAVHAKLMRTVSGVGGSLLRARPAYLAKIRVPLPLLSEQRRIAVMLDKAGDIRRARGASIRLLKGFRVSLFKAFFEHDIRERVGATVPLERVAEIVSGVTKGRSVRGHGIRQVPYLRVANVQEGHLELRDVKSLDASSVEILKFRLEVGDILLTEGGDPDKLGRGAVWRGEINECIHQNHVFRARVTDPAFIPEYVSALLGSPHGKRYFLKAAKQTTGIASINRTQLGDFPVIPVPIDRQRRFAAALEAARQHLSRVQAAASIDNELYHALSTRAFGRPLAP